MKTKAHDMGKRLIALALSLIIGRPGAALAERNDSSASAPIVRSPDVTQDELEVFAEANGRITLSDQLNLQRPGPDIDNQLFKAVEDAQGAWLAGSLTVALNHFKAIARQALEADWREPQREAIHYAFLRLAQSAPTPLEKEEWLEKAISIFPDLLPNTDLYPPPFIQLFQSIHVRILAEAKVYRPSQHFSGYRYLLINGKKYVLTSDLKIRLPNGQFRVTALSDAYPPITEKLSRSQMEAFRLSVPALIQGSCEAPQANHSGAGERITKFTALFPAGCLREKSSQGWTGITRESDEDFLHPFAPAARMPESQNSDIVAAAAYRPERPGISRRTWLWIGVSTLAAGALYVIYRERNKTAEPEKQREIERVPAATHGF